MKTRLANCTGVLMGAALAALFSLEMSQTAASESPPNFSSAAYGFAARGEGWKALPGSPPPVDQDPRVRYVPNNTPGEQPTYRYADANNPNLTQWAKDHLKKDNELQDKGFHMFSRQARCWPELTPRERTHPRRACARPRAAMGDGRYKMVRSPDRKSTRLNSSHYALSRMPSSA